MFGKESIIAYMDASWIGISAWYTGYVTPNKQLIK